MIVLSHRGYWKKPEEKNTFEAFDRSFGLGFGTETDVRDCCGPLVISHDPPTGKEMNFDDFIALAKKANVPLAINIKADGLALGVNKAMRDYDPDKWFVFDMSVPDTRMQLAAGNPVFARLSEMEKECDWFDAAAGIWLDAFEGTWYSNDFIHSLRMSGKRVCIVSADLHKRDQKTQWQQLLELRNDAGIMLCTDFPEDAKSFFGV